MAALDAEIIPYLSDPDEHFHARASDLIDLRDRVRAQLRPGGPAPLQAIAKPAGAVLLADDLTPSQFLTLDWSSGGAIVLAQGSCASHVALLARSRAIPMLVGCGEPPAGAHLACVDGEAGEVVFDPDPATLAQFGQRLEALGPQHVEFFDSLKGVLRAVLLVMNQYHAKSLKLLSELDY
jgi:phosphotransferase system enzyme I (PtsI)